MAFEPPERDGVLATNAAPLDDAPASGGERGVDALSSRFGFLHDKLALN
jgi:hypothetical protein